MLNGKVAVVTGASRGIGRQIAISMAKEGAVVIVNYNGSAAKAEDVVKEITEAGGQAEAVQCNVSDYSAAEVFLKDIISRYKRIDILVTTVSKPKMMILMWMPSCKSRPSRSPATSGRWDGIGSSAATVPRRKPTPPSWTGARRTSLLPTRPTM